MELVKRKPAFIGIKDIEAGDIITFKRADGLYFHCGIYDGHGKVIHRAAAPRSGSRAALDKNSLFATCGIECDKVEIRKDDLNEVAGSSYVYRTNMLDKVSTPCPGQEIVNWAEERIGQKGYNVLFKNCQHFCTEARYGVSAIMQFQELLGNEMNSTLVNIVNLPDMSFQQVANTTANTTAVENSVKECGEGCVGDMLQCMDLDDRSVKELYVLACLRLTTKPLHTIPKHYKSSTGNGKGFDRYSTNTNLNSNRTEVTSNCSIKGDGRVVLRPAEPMTGASAACDTYILFAEFEIECNTADLIFVARSFDVKRSLMFYQNIRLHYGPKAFNSTTHCTDMRTDVNRPMAFSYENAGKQLCHLDVGHHSGLRVTSESPSNCSIPQPAAANVSPSYCSIPKPAAANVSPPNCSIPQPAATNVSPPNCSKPQPAATNVSPPYCSIPQPAATNVSPPNSSIPQPAAANVSPPNSSIPQPAAENVSPPNCCMIKPVGCYEIGDSLDDIYTTCKECMSENSISDETYNELFYVCVFIFVLLFVSIIFWSILYYSDLKRQRLRARLSGRT